MPGDEEKGAFAADIPGAAIEEALRSVEKRGEDAGDEGVEVAVEGEAPAAGSEAREPGAEQAGLAAQLELSMQKGRETMERLREEHDRFLRAAADLENYKKRAAREREEIQRFANERLLKDLIPVLDNLERALQSAPAEDSVAGGVRLVLRSFEETLGRHGVEIFSAMGRPFDPRLHEAILQLARADLPPGTVVLEHGRGFLLQGRLVRPAMVGVSVAAVPGESPGGGGSPAPDEGAEPEQGGAA